MDCFPKYVQGWNPMSWPVVRSTVLLDMDLNPTLGPNKQAKMQYILYWSLFFYVFKKMFYITWYDTNATIFFDRHCIW